MKKLFLFIATIFLIYPRVALAQELNYQCVGKGLADYMNAIISGAGSLSNVKLLSPAFNMTSYTFDGIVNAMGQSGANFGGLAGIAGNVYNTDNRRITSWLTEKLANSNISGKDIYLTETGEKDVADNDIPRHVGKDRLREELKILKDLSNRWHVKASVLFNVFNNNDKFSTFSWDKTELNYICEGSCFNVGANSAAYFNQENNYGLYQDASDTGMSYVVEIANNDQVAAQKAVRRALEKGLTPIIRVGVGDNGDGFENTQTYIDFLTQLNSYVAGSFSGRNIYALAGPNEPDTEFWATSSCKTSQLPTKKSPLDEGFDSLKYPCDGNPADSEYHPLRPYPGSPCDTLIPRSIPEAPSSPEKKYNTFACGSSLTPQREEVFDPYGKNGAYELQEREGFAHTVCYPSEFGTSDQEKRDFKNMLQNGGTVTCWRTSAFDITVDLAHANVGILGNTQDNTLTDAQKVNEYLSWYLTGTPQIGDQLPINPKNPNDIDRVVNFSGPIRKLLPFDLQNTAKGTIVASAGKDVHDYIVGCKKDVDLTYVVTALEDWVEATKSNIRLIWTLLTISPSLPYDIYDFISKTTGASVQLIPVLQHFTVGDTPKILDILSPLGETKLGEDLATIGENSAVSLNRLGNLINSLNLDMAESCQTSNDAKRLKEFADHLPPDPADPKYKDNFNKYWDDYIWWRGMINLPLVGPIDWINQDIWAKLFQNIPFSSMEDTTGEFTMSVFRDPSFDQQVDSLDSPQYSSVVNKNTAPLQLIIKSAELAK